MPTRKGHEMARSKIQTEYRLSAAPLVSISLQWRRQDLLRGGAQIESRSWGTHGGLQGRVQQLIDD